MRDRENPWGNQGNPGGPDFGRRRDTGPNGGSNGRPANGRPANGRPGGARPGGITPRPIPFPPRGGTGPAEELDFAEEPLDLVAVQADDELINALAAGMTVSAPGNSGYDADDRVAAMLAAWKAEVDADPIPELVDLDTAVAAVESGSPRRASNRRRHLIPLAGAAALLVFSIGGVSIGAHGAEPGDALFGVTQVLYKDAANSRVAAAEVKQRIQTVNEKLQRGDSAGAQADIVAMAPLLEQVRPEEGKTYLAAEQTFLAKKSAETPQGQAVDPQAPLHDGTPRPTPPSNTEGGKDKPVVPPPVSSSPTTSPPPSSAVTAPGGNDPRIVKDPPSSGAPSVSTPPSSSAPPTSGTAEGKPDPSTSSAPPSSGTTTSSLGSTTDPASSSSPVTGTS
ncbi:hypothetical protein GCM10009836_68530 [Pseudonocardia ailaonensis]|uniref:Anti-sigma-D factor RsdA sigma factor binding region domain-containing protein n=1 Tax=Pseudonocardia ailaonensis TaxID=367279 RepID=A0ABN2NNQ2_9PSEU